MRRFLKAISGRSFWMRYALLAAWRLSYAAFSAITGANVSGHWGEGDRQMQQYSEIVFRNYKLWSGIAKFHGRVAEVGPGRVSGVAELMLGDGAEQVEQIDRFHYRRAADAGIAQYRAEAADFFEKNRGYDFIVSNAVLEHVGDPLRVLRAMAGALKPGGTMIHVVDCRDHGQFSDSFEELAFLRIPAALYWPLRPASGLNRVRISEYLRELERLGLKYRALVTTLTGVPEIIEPVEELERLDAALVQRSRAAVEAMRARLARPFREMPESDLMISGFVLTAWRE